MAPKPCSRPRRAYVTLIVNFPVSGGFVIGADTKELVEYPDGQGGTYTQRRTVQKLRPESIGAYQIAIAGAGDARLVDAFSLKAQRAIANVAQPGASSLLTTLEAQLGDFYRNDVPLLQDAGDFKLFIAYCCPTSGEHGVYISELTSLREADRQRPELIGWEHELYSKTAERVHRTTMSVSQGVLAALQVLTVADETSDFIDEPFHVAVVRDNGIWMEPEDHISALTGRLRAFDNRMGQLFLACADTALSPQSFDEALANFGEESVLLHKQQLDDEIRRMLRAGLFTVNSPYPHIPPGSVIFLKAPPDASLRIQPDAQFEVDFLTEEHPVQFEVDTRRVMADILRAQHGSTPEPPRDNSAQSSTPSGSAVDGLLMDDMKELSREVSREKIELAPGFEAEVVHLDNGESGYTESGLKTYLDWLESKSLRNRLKRLWKSSIRKVIPNITRSSSQKSRDQQ
jgi:hypothetical protein